MVDREVEGQHVFSMYVFFILSIDGRSSSRWASWGGLGRLSGPLWVVLGRSQGLCGRSWAALRASVGAPGPFSRLLCAVLGRLGVFVGDPGPS